MSNSEEKRPLLLGVLGSGRGSNLEAIAGAIDAGFLRARIALVLSDVADAGIGEVARRRGLPFELVPASAYRTRLEPEIEQRVARRFRETGVELLVLAGYMRVVKTPLLEVFPGRIINVHPSLLPSFPGREAWKQALQAGVRWTGCTVHRVDSGVDTGEVLAQKQVPVLPEDTPETLHARIQQAEHVLYPEVLRSFAERRL